MLGDADLAGAFHEERLIAIRSNLSRVRQEVSLLLPSTIGKSKCAGIFCCKAGMLKEIAFAPTQRTSYGPCDAQSDLKGWDGSKGKAMLSRTKAETKAVTANTHCSYASARPSEGAY